MTEGKPFGHCQIEHALIAQSVEHAAVNRGVTGSSPVWGATLPELLGYNVFPGAF